MVEAQDGHCSGHTHITTTDPMLGEVRSHQLLPLGHADARTESVDYLETTRSNFPGVNIHRHVAATLTDQPVPWLP